MSRTIKIMGSEEVMAAFAKPGRYYRGKWEYVKITRLIEDEDMPLEIRTALVGLIIPTIFTKESIEKQSGASFPVPENSRFAYGTDIVDVLKSAGKQKEAEQLAGIADSPLDMCTINPQSYELVHAAS